MQPSIHATKQDYLQLEPSFDKNNITFISIEGQDQHRNPPNIIASMPASRTLRPKNTIRAHSQLTMKILKDCEINKSEQSRHLVHKSICLVCREQANSWYKAMTVSKSVVFKIVPI